MREWSVVGEKKGVITYMDNRHFTGGGFENLPWILLHALRFPEVWRRRRQKGCGKSLNREKHKSKGVP